jgi:hypothetical protein
MGGPFPIWNLGSTLYMILPLHRLTLCPLVKIQVESIDYQTENEAEVIYCFLWVNILLSLGNRPVHSWTRSISFCVAEGFSYRIKM